MPKKPVMPYKRIVFKAEAASVGDLIAWKYLSLEKSREMDEENGLVKVGGMVFKQVRTGEYERAL